MYYAPHERYSPPVSHGLRYDRYDWSFHPFTDIARVPPDKLKLFLGDGVEGVTFLDTRKRVLLPDDQGEFVLRHEDRHCKLPDMLERENHAWDTYEGK